MALRRTRDPAGGSGDRDGEVLVAVLPEVLHDAEHAVGNLLQRIHHVSRVSLAGAEAEQRDRVRVALSDLERLLELLFDYVSPVAIEARPTDAGRVASSIVSQVRAHAGDGVEMVGQPNGKLMVDPRALTRCFQLIGDSLGGHWKLSQVVGVDVQTGDGDEGMAFAVRSADGKGAPLSAAARVGLAVAGRLIEMQGGELHWGGDAEGGCRVVLPVQSEGQDDGV